MQVQEQTKKALPGIPKGAVLPKGTKPSRPPPKDKAEKEARKAAKRAERNAFLKARDEATIMLVNEICSLDGAVYDPPVVTLKPINIPKLSPNVPAAEVPVTIPAENDNAPTAETTDSATPAESSEASVDAPTGSTTSGQSETDAVVATAPEKEGTETAEAVSEAPVSGEPSVPDATGVTVAEDEIKVSDDLVAESDAADAAELERIKAKAAKKQKLSKAEAWKLRQAANAANKAKQAAKFLKRNPEDTAFVAAPTEVENKPEVDPEPAEKSAEASAEVFEDAEKAEPKGDALKQFADTIGAIADGVTANQDRPSDTEEAPNNAPITETPTPQTEVEETPAQEAPTEEAQASDGDAAKEAVVEATESPKAEPAEVKVDKKPTLTLVHDTGNNKFSDINTETVNAARKFYGKAFTDDRAKQLATAYKWLLKAIEYEIAGNKHCEVALKAALKNEHEAFGVGMAQAA